MAMPNTQPTLPPEGAFSDAELLWLDEEPKRVFPENQNSNWGLLRRILTMEPQEATDTLTELFQQMFVATTTAESGYLDKWEKQMGLPIAPTGYTEAVRRQFVALRRRIGLFSTSRVNETLEAFLGFTSGGAPTELTPAGVPTSAAGFTLYAEGGPATTKYRVYYNPTNFSYEVWIVSSSTPDLLAVRRMLDFITPSGMSYTLDNSRSAIIDYGRTVRSKQPVAHYRLNGDVVDASSYANNGTAFGTFTAVASPGLLTAGKADDQAARTWDGASAYFTAPDQAWLDFGDVFTIEFWIRPVSITGTQIIIDKGANSFQISMASGNLQLVKSGVAGAISIPTLAMANGVTRHVVLRKSGSTVKWTIDNVDRSGTVTPATIENNALPLYVGRLTTAATNYYNGALDEIAVYNRYLTDAEIASNYNAGKNIL